MKQTILFLFVASILGLCGFFVITYTPFNNLKGPLAISVVEQPIPTPMNVFQQGGLNTLAVLVTDRGSSWLELANGLKTFGIPFTMTTDYKEAIKHKAILAYPLNWNNLLTNQARMALKKFPESGGTLIASGVSSPSLNPTFGFSDSTISQSHNAVHFVNPEKYGLIFEGEKSFSIGSEADPSYNLSTYDSYDVTGKTLAYFEDGTPAILEQKYPKGRAIAIMFDIGEILINSHSLEMSGYNPLHNAVNYYEPFGDTIFRWLRVIYQNSEPNAVVIGTTPFNKKFTTLITHDIDYRLSYPRAIKFAEFERSMGVKATYFLQTKYSMDYNDTAFFNRRAVRVLRRLQSLGMELGSHSVSHSPSFYFFPLGTGHEYFPNYDPMVMNMYYTQGGTVLGELRVSKFLLEQVAFPNTKIISFRSGYLQFPKTLPQALAATGYLYDSSMSSFESKSYFPFQLTFSSGGDSNVNIYEFPVSFDEGETLLDRAPKWNLPLMLALGRKLENQGALFNILIHTDKTNKILYEKKYIETFRDTSWFSTLKEFGGWWAARDNIQIMVEDKGTQRIVHIFAPQAIKGLTIEVPPNWHYRASYPEHILYNTNINKYAFNQIQGAVSLVFEM